MIAWLLGSSTGRIVVLCVTAVTAAGIVVLLVYRQGEAAALATAAITALERTSAAARARAEVKPNDQEAMKHDPFNRDRAR